MSSDTEDQITSPDEFYEKCYNHWSKIPATMNGVLDGLSHISCIDVSGSEEFLEKIYRVSALEFFLQPPIFYTHYIPKNTSEMVVEIGALVLLVV